MSEITTICGINPLTILWGILIIVFILLAVIHFILMKKKIKHFKAPTLSELRFGKDADKMPTSFWDKPLQTFQEQVNDFVNDLNKDNKLIHEASAFGYIGAAITAAVSFYLTL